MINQVAEKYNGEVTAADNVEFSVNGSDFVLTDGTLYQSFDGQFGAGCKKVKTLAAVEKFVNLRA